MKNSPIVTKKTFGRTERKSRQLFIDIEDALQAGLCPCKKGKFDLPLLVFWACGGGEKDIGDPPFMKMLSNINYTELPEKERIRLEKAMAKMGRALRKALVIVMEKEIDRRWTEEMRNLDAIR